MEIVNQGELDDLLGVPKLKAVKRIRLLKELPKAPVGSEWEVVGRLHPCILIPPADGHLVTTTYYLSEMEDWYEEVVGWKPEINTRYWTISLGHKTGITSIRWDEDISDINRYKCKAVFKTKDEALDALEKITEVLE